MSATQAHPSSTVGRHMRPAHLLVPLVLMTLPLGGGCHPFEDIDDYKARINDDDLDIDETCVMVLKNCGVLNCKMFTSLNVVTIS